MDRPFGNLGGKQRAGGKATGWGDAVPSTTMATVWVRSKVRPNGGAIVELGECLPSQPPRLIADGQLALPKARDYLRPVALRKHLHQSVCLVARLCFPPMRVNEQVGVLGDHVAPESP